MLSGYAKPEWSTILAIGVMLTVTLIVVGWWPLAIVVVIAAAALLAFFRDPHRRTPTQRGIMTAPADGRISSIHRVEHYDAFDGPATCIRIFLSVLDVHVNRSPCHGIVDQITHKPGDHLNALNPDSAEVNESITIVLLHPIRRHPIAAVRQIAGMLARTVVCAARQDMVLQRGQRYGIIKFGSTTELYIPETLAPRPAVEQGQYVYGGLTVLAEVGPLHPGQSDDSALSSEDRPIDAPRPTIDA
jgi:phosphatidylserine decarboxylase